MIAFERRQKTVKFFARSALDFLKTSEAEVETTNHYNVIASCS